MKIAIASSGLGHVSRGIETWARDVAAALAGCDVDVTLFAGGRAGMQDAGESGKNVQRPTPNLQPPTSKRGALCWKVSIGRWLLGVDSGGKKQDESQPASRGLRTVPLPCLRRNDRPARCLASLCPGWLWRWGFKSTYGWEQFSFWLQLWPRLRRGRFDILHVQDPMVADWCRRFRKAGLVRTREILAHGTEEPSAFLARFDYVQHLAPWHLRETLQSLESLDASQSAGAWRKQTERPTSNIAHPTSKQEVVRWKVGVGRWLSGVDEGEGAEGSGRGDALGGHPSWTAIPNFVDTEAFRPVRDDDEKQACRKALGLPVDVFLFGCVAAVKRVHKRIDYLIEEFAQAASECEDAHLLIAGSAGGETPELKQLAEERCPGRIHFLLDLPHQRMPDLYRAVDVFVLASLYEMMPIALLEALASGLPVICHQQPVLEWMAGEAGRWGDLHIQGALSAMLADMRMRADSLELGARGRRRAETLFARDSVIPQILTYYEQIMGKK
jgi:glycosyltransferase involved in cell wall biosynthesis